MKNASTGKTSPAEIVNAPDCPSSCVSDWEGAVLKQGGVVVGRARTRGPNREPLKEPVAVRYSPEVLVAFRSTGPGWQTRMNGALRDWLRTHVVDVIHAQILRILRMHHRHCERSEAIQVHNDLIDAAAG